jgi:hypothetical protein
MREKTIKMNNNTRAVYDEMTFDFFHKLHNADLTAGEKMAIFHAFSEFTKFEYKNYKADKVKEENGE